MARTAITPQTVTTAGAAITLEAANVAGNSVDLTTGAKVMWIKNGDAGSITVTLPSVATVDGLALADRTVTIAGTTEKHFRLHDAQKRTDGTVYINYSAVTSVTVAALNA